MSEFFYLSTFLGCVLGILHAVHILRHHSALPGTEAMATQINRALWAVVLWTIFGAYLVVFWLLGFVLRPFLRRGRA